MNSNSILSSNLLDIIFENRNKDYGAYVLRRDYNKRLTLSLITVFAMVIFFAVLQLLKSTPVHSINSFSKIPDQTILPPPQFEKKDVIKPKITTKELPKAVDEKAHIVENFDEKAVLVIDQSPASDNRDNVDNSPFETNGTNESFPPSEENKAPVKQTISSIDKEVPVNAEVLPQYPGGINELIKFLRRNLNTPKELEDGEVISVKVKFIVNYNGSLMGFDVIETGGRSFDNEVLRVLKKMPKWIPGKSQGENVSAYFIVPVKFVVSD